MSSAASPGLWPCGPIVDTFGSITGDLDSKGWAVRDDFVPREWAAELLDEQRLQSRRGAFRPAGIGRNDAYQLDSHTRGDQILWLDQGNALPAQRQYLALLEELRLAVNRDLFLGLYELETQAAIYPPGGFYRHHLDGFQQGNLRTLTVILYLNPRWRAHDGGELRLYLNAPPDSEFLDLLPESGRLVTFLSERFHHEVLATRRARSSITSWLSRRPLPLLLASPQP
jgi:SM-20-related protein